MKLKKKNSNPSKLFIRIYPKEFIPKEIKVFSLAIIQNSLHKYYK